MQLNPVRVIICNNVLTTSQLVHTRKKGIEWGGKKSVRESTILWYNFQVAKREATLWNIMACLAKDNAKRAIHHAPPERATAYIKEASRRLTKLTVWVQRNPTAAKQLQTVYENSRRVKEVPSEAVCVGA